MNKWDYIFKGGKQTDKTGYVHSATETEEMIDNAVTGFDPDFHEPPLVLGHPKDNSPKFGVVEELRKVVEGGVPYLQAKYKEVAPEFKEWVDKKLFQKKSASFYPNGNLRHVGYLGGTPPAVKGLPDFAFSEREEVSFDFSKSADSKIPLVGDIVQKIRDFVISLKGVDEADKVVRQWEIDELKRKPETREGLVQNYSEQSKKEDTGMTPEEQKKAIEDARAEGREEFAEKEKALVKENTELKQEKQDARKTEISSFCEGLKVKGVITPAMEKSGLASFMENLEAEQAVEFAEGEGGKSTLLEFMKSFLQGLPPQVGFTEVSGGGVTVDTEDAEALAGAATEFKEAEAKAGRTITITQAVNHVRGAQKK